MSSRWRGWLGVALIVASAAVEVPRAQEPIVSSSADGRPVRASDQKRVLVLYLARAGQPAWVVFDDTLTAALHDAFQGQVDFYREYLDSGRFALTDAYLGNFRNYLAQKYKGIYEPDVVVAVIPSASEFTKYGEGLFPHVPVLLVALTEERPTYGTTVFIRTSPDDPLRLALSLQPRTKRVFVVSGASDFDWSLDENRQRFRSVEGRLDFTYLAGLPIENLERTLEHLPQDSVIYYLGLSLDGAGRRFEGLTALDRIAAVANVPIYVEAETMVGHGTLGGRVWSSRPWALKTADVVGRLLRGETPDAIPVSEIGAFADEVDWRQLRRWGINESLVPEGTQILFREPTIWDQYGAYVLGTLGVVALQGTIIGALLVQRRQRRRVEVALRASEATAQASVREVRDLAGRLITAREDERARIARDLHDDIGQRVASFSIGLSRLKPQLPEAARTLSDLERQAMRLSTDLRQLSHQLHPATLVHLGLLEALRERCEEFQQESGVAVRLDVSERWRDVPEAIALCCYRVVQEALRNAGTHARARQVCVSLDRRDATLLLRVTDDGCGFDTAASQSGLGLISLSERVRMLAGVLDVTSAPGAGSTVTVRFPEGEVHAPSRPAR